jgi:hypothetical protein
VAVTIAGLTGAELRETNRVSAANECDRSGAAYRGTAKLPAKTVEGTTVQPRRHPVPIEIWVMDQMGRLS